MMNGEERFFQLIVHHSIHRSSFNDKSRAGRAPENRQKDITKDVGRFQVF